MEEREIVKVIRWAKNGRKYVWNNPTKEQFKMLVEKYGIDKITPSGVVWLIN